MDGNRIAHRTYYGYTNEKQHDDEFLSSLLWLVGLPARRGDQFDSSQNVDSTFDFVVSSSRRCRAAVFDSCARALLTLVALTYSMSPHYTSKQHSIHPFHPQSQQHHITNQSIRSLWSPRTSHGNESRASSVRLLLHPRTVSHTHSFFSVSLDCCCVVWRSHLDLAGARLFYSSDLIKSY